MANGRRGAAQARMATKDTFFRDLRWGIKVCTAYSAAGMAGTPIIISAQMFARCLASQLLGPGNFPDQQIMNAPEYAAPFYQF